MMRIVSALAIVALLVACGADGSPTTPLKERLADRAAAQEAEAADAAALEEELSK